MSSTLRFGFHIDRDFVVPFYFRFQHFYGVAILAVHAIVFYLLKYHTKIWSRAVRIGYLLNQAQMLVHDVWTCFLLQGYTLLPYPGIFCAGAVCAQLGGYNAFMIEGLCMVHSISILLFMVLMVHQQILPPTSKFVVPRWASALILCVVYAGLLIGATAGFLIGSESPDTARLLETDDLKWTREYAAAVILFGSLGDSGSFRYCVYIIIISIALIAPFRIFLIDTAVRFLKNQRAISSKTMTMKRNIISILTNQSACVSVFYIYPLLVNNILFEFQIAFIPDSPLVAIRTVFVFMFMLNTFAQFLVMIKSNKPFRKVLKSKFVVLVDRFVQKTTNNPFVTNISLI